MSALDKYIYHYNEFASFETSQIGDIVSSNLLDVKSLNLNSINHLSSMFTELKKTINNESDLTVVDQIIYILSKIVEYYGLGNRDKVEIQPSSYGLDTILNLQPILYREITPTGIVINHEGDKIAGINNTELTTDAIIGALINSIKDLKKLIDDQAKEIDTLKKQENKVIVISS
jgi:hypothetical protein